MSIKWYKAEQIVTMLRQIEVGMANGKTTPQACKEVEITMQTNYRWRLSECGNFCGVIVPDYHCVTSPSRSHVNPRETSLN
jgi:hypothetical protein